jgi:hypothetical protein
LLTHAFGALGRKRGPQLLLAVETLAPAEEQMCRTEDATRWREPRSAEFSGQPSVQQSLNAARSSARAMRSNSQG